MRSFQFEFRWRRLKDISGSDFIYGTKLGKLRSTTAHPAIYRWAVVHKGKLIKVYVGETENLGRRLYQYMSPGPTQQTNLRLRQEFLAAEAQGDTVLIETLEFEPFEINGANISVETLSEESVRRLLEALACLQREDGVAPLNR